MQPDSGVNFYEKLCLRGVKQSRFDNLCQAERGWAFERVVGGLLEGFNHKEINNIETRGECARLCLLEDDFPCRYGWQLFLSSLDEIFFSGQQNIIQTTEDVFSVEMIEELNLRHSGLELGKIIEIILTSGFLYLLCQGPH